MKMKKIFAVVATIVALCAVTGCGKDSLGGSNYDTESKGLTTQPKQVSCRQVSLKTPEADGAITRSMRAAADEDWSKPDGLFEVTTLCEQRFVGVADADTLKKYEVRNRYRSFGVVNKPRYIKSIANLREGSPVLTMDNLPDGRVRHLVKNKDGEDHSLDYSLVEESFVESDTTWVKDRAGNRKGFVRCKDSWENLKFQNREVTDLGVDSAKWHKYKVVDIYNPTLISHLDCGAFKVSYIVWEWTGSGDPDFPDDEWEVIRYFTKNEWITPEKISDLTGKANSGFEVYAFLSDGTEKFYCKKSVDLSNSIEALKRDTVTTSDFEWKALDAVLYNEGTDGALYQKKDSIWVQPLKVTYQTNVNKGSREYLLKREGRAYWVDPLGENHYFKEGSWNTADTDKGWEKSDLAADNTYKYILLTSSIAPTYLGLSYSASSELALRMLKDGDNKLIGYKVMNYDIKRVTPVSDYYTYAELWGVYSKGEPQKIKEFGTHTGVSVITPEAQTITVTDWNITDGQPQWYGESRLSERKDTLKDGDHIIGVFHITPIKKTYATRTNKSDDKFQVTWDKTITFTDEFGKDWDGFITLDPKPSDKGGVKTMVDLSDEDDYQRKQMTTTMNLVVREDNADYTGEVIFRKKVEKEELIEGPTVTPSWTWFNNGQGGTGSLKITYRLKLGGPKEINVSQDEEWSITNEAKSHIILSSASADHQNIDNSISWGTTTSSNPQTGVTLYTTTGTIKDHYSTLVDGYTTKKQTATYTFSILGKSYSYDFPAPSDMTVAYKTSSLVNGNRTASESGKNYDVYDHTGTVTATVSSASDGNQTQDATDLKEIWVAKNDPTNPDFNFDATWHAGRGNRFYTGAQWCDGFLYSNDNNYFIVAYFFSLNHDKTKESLVKTETYTIPKSEMGTPTTPFNGVMWDPAKGKAIPCLITVDGEGWSLGTRYADGTAVTKRHGREEAVSSGVKNLAENDNATPSPIIATSWSEAKKNGHIYYTAGWHTTTHTMSHTVGFKDN
ncbi:MAG: hypothetical protein IJ545_06695 [Alphaproteobacteria bacterium]|nr:hypothetical protein [Alphaproteobacteria bacterium]